MLDRITGMRVLVNAMELGSLSGAARRLEISPAMAAKHVDALEARLGVKLLHRTTRRLHLSEAGERYLEACRRILAEIDEAEADAVSQGAEVSGLLRLNMPLSFGIQIIAPLLPAFLQRHPGLTLEMELSDHRVDLLAEGWDVAIRLTSLHASNSTLRARKLGDYRLLVCAAPSYLARCGRPRRMEELRDHECLGYTLSSSSGTREWAFGRNGQRKVTITSRVTANNGRALVAMAVGGLGIIYQPDFIVRDALNRGELEVIELEHEELGAGGVYALYPPQRQPPAKVRALIDYLVEAL